MDLIFGLALRAGLLVYCFVVPGWALLRWAGFRTASHVDRALACVAAGAAATSLTVTTLLLAGLYYRPLLICYLAAPAAYLIWSRKRVVAPRPQAPVTFTTSLEPIDRAVLVACAGFLAVYLLDAWTSPITWWDGLASWGKWAADWGRRTSSANYVVGGYPQLVPRIVSVMYKLTGAHADVLPLDFFALHGVYVLFAVWFLAAAVRLTTVLSMPAWPVVLAGLGSMQFREHSAAGTVDVLVSALLTTVLALYFGLRQGTWTARREPVVLAAASFAAIFTKWNGGLAIVLMLILDRASRVVLPVAPEKQAALTRTVVRAIAIAGIGLIPFIAEQGLSELRIHRWRPDPFEVNISIRQMPTLLSTDANVVYRGGDAKVQAGLVQLRFWNSYDVPATLRLVFSGFLLLTLAASVRTWFGSAVVPVVAVYGAIWMYWSSYDQRNVFVLLPVIALAVSFGVARLWRLPPPVLWRNGLALVAGLFLVLAGSGLLKDGQARLSALKGIGARLTAMRGGVADKVAQFYPQLEQDFRFLSSLSERTAATHVLVTYPLFRFFDRGAHALSLWPYELVRPGDVFAAHEWHTPPADPRWVFLARHGRHRIWLRVGELEAAKPRMDEIAGGDVHRVLVDVRPEDIGEEGFVVWRATVPRQPEMSAGIFEASPDLRLDPVLVSTVCEEAAEGTAGLECSGIVGLERDAVASYRRGMLAVGVATDANPGSITLKVARPLRPRGAPRQ